VVKGGGEFFGAYFDSVVDVGGEGVGGVRERGLCFLGQLGSGSSLHERWKSANLSIPKVELCEVDHALALLWYVIILHRVELFSLKVVPTARNMVSSMKADLSSLGFGDGAIKLAL